MSNAYICPWHHVVLPKGEACPQCQTEFENRKDAKAMTAEERAVALEEMIEKCIVTIPPGQIHQRIEELVGRPVHTHELAGKERAEMLVTEIRSGAEARLDDVLEKLPEDKPVIIIATGDV